MNNFFFIIMARIYLFFCKYDIYWDFLVYRLYKHASRIGFEYAVSCMRKGKFFHIDRPEQFVGSNLVEEMCSKSVGFWDSLLDGYDTAYMNNRLGIQYPALSYACIRDCVTCEGMYEVLDGELYPDLRVHYNEDGTINQPLQNLQKDLEAAYVQYTERVQQIRGNANYLLNQKEK